MKKDIHPKNYRLVVFKDMSNEIAFMSRSTVNTKDTIVWEDGKEYPLVKLEISNTSHPFYTGKMKLVDTAGRVDKFYQRTWSNPDFKEENPGESDWYGYYRMGYVPYANDPMMGSSWARKSCIDCRLAGGTKTRPDDWPNGHK